METTAMTQPPRKKAGRPKGTTKKRIQELTHEERLERLDIIARKDLLNSEEAGLFTKLSVGRVKSLARQGRIRHYKTPGGRFVFKKCDLIHFLKTQTYEVVESKETLADTYDATKKALA